MTEVYVQWQKIKPNNSNGSHSIVVTTSGPVSLAVILAVLTQIIVDVLVVPKFAKTESAYIVKLFFSTLIFSIKMQLAI